MFRNYFKSALRHLKKNRFFTAINITGLAIGLAASILLFLYIRFELSYDRFHQHHEQIYRVVSHVQRPEGKSVLVPRTLPAVSKTIKRDIPEVVQSCRIYPKEVTLRDNEDHLFPDVEFFYTDSSFFDLFSFEVHRGDGPSALRTPGQVVITRSLAKQYFGDQDPLNREILREGKSYTVGAVLEDIPANSHFDFDLLTGFHTMKHLEYFMERQGWNMFTYFRVRPGSERSVWGSKVSESANQVSASAMQDMGGDGAFDVETRLQSLSRIHLHSDYNFDIDPQGDVQRIYIFSFLAAFILMIALVNFVNLVTAHGEYRAREVGMRKVLGARRRSLIKQHLLESFVMVFFATLISLVLAEGLASPLGKLLGSELAIDWLNPWLIFGLIGFVLLVGLIAGSYPAFYLSRFNPIKIFSQTASQGSRKRTLQVGLVVVQFGIAIFLITSLIILRSQLNYLSDKDLGVSKNHVLVVKEITAPIRQSYSAIREELIKHPSIQSVTASFSVPGMNRPLQTARKTQDSPDESIVIQENRVQDHYLETYGIELVKGRGFNPKMATDKTSFILNQQAVDKLGLSRPIGKEIVVFKQKGQIIGVINDFHFRSFHHQIDPLVLTHYSSYFNHLSIQTHMQDFPATLQHVRQTLQEFDSGYYFKYTFLDEIFAQLHQQDKQTNQLIMYGSLLAIFLALLGLFALSSLTVVKRSREIAVRKAMGATYQRVVRLLLSDILRWVVWVNILAWPAAYFFMNDWLQNFAYRIDPQLWMFLGGGAIALLIAGLTISVQTLRAAAVNPAERLRDE